MTTTAQSKRPRRVTVVAVLIGLAILTVLASLASVLFESIPHLRAGTVPDDPYNRNYVAHPWPAALHIVPGLIYLLGAPLQLSAGFRRKHLILHRRLGRIILPSGMVAGVFALVIGISHPFDGLTEGSATVLFATWFLVSLALAFAAVRRRDIAGHRRWMIRAYAAGIGIGAIRLWVGILGAIQSAVTGTTVMSPQQGTYGLAFWLGLGSSVLVGEWWLRHPVKRPAKSAA